MKIYYGTLYWFFVAAPSLRQLTNADLQAWRSYPGKAVDKIIRTYYLRVHCHRASFVL